MIKRNIDKRIKRRLKMSATITDFHCEFGIEISRYEFTIKIYFVKNK